MCFVIFDQYFSKLNLNIPLEGVKAVLGLTEEGSTVPFIARYRKEKTGNLDEVQIRNVIDSKEKFDEIVKRQAFITGEIEKQGKLTPELNASIQAAFDLDKLEDLYLPYKQKRKTKAAIAKEQGLEPLADLAVALMKGNSTLQLATMEAFNAEMAKLISEDNKIGTLELVAQGVQDILVERVSLDLEVREFVRKAFNEAGFLYSKKGPKAGTPSKFENYFDYCEPVKSLKEPKHSHRYLALRRGWMEEELIVNLAGPPDQQEAFEAHLLNRFEVFYAVMEPHYLVEFFKKIAKTAYKVHVFPSIETEVHRVLKELADVAAIQVFAGNVRNLLLASPYGGKATLGVDPGIRTGCKLAIINANGQYVASTVIFPQTPLGQKEAAVIVKSCIEEAKISAIAVGNGTAGRETELFLRKMLSESGHQDIPVVMVSESGASVYSASETAREEFPDLDLTVRGAISIARRFQDPLAELVKIDPKSIGVGQYQHDVQQNQLKKSIEAVVDSCVNYVGVNLNTASYHLLEHVSGIGPSLAKSIVEFRAQQGTFKSREDLLNVPRFSKKSFEQAAGFLRIADGSNPLDNTGVHPEKYDHIVKFAKSKSLTVPELLKTGAELLEKDEEFKKEVGEFTFRDIVSELKKPGRDPRDCFSLFQFREDIHEIKDLKEGMICPGIVTNVTNFGAFVDIGVHQDGLVHISQITDRFISDPGEVVKSGDRVQVKVVEFSTEKKKIALTMRLSEPRAMPNPGQNNQQRHQSRGPQARPSNDHRDGPQRGPSNDQRAFNSQRPSDPSRARDSQGPANQGRPGQSRPGDNRRPDAQRSGPQARPAAQAGAANNGRSFQGAARDQGPARGGPANSQNQRGAAPNRGPQDRPRSGQGRPDAQQGRRDFQPNDRDRPRQADFKNNAFGQMAGLADAFKQITPDKKAK